MDIDTDPGCCRAKNSDMTPDIALGWMLAQATQINMAPEITWSSDTKMAAGGGPAQTQGIPVTLVATRRHVHQHRC